MVFMILLLILIPKLLFAADAVTPKTYRNSIDMDLVLIPAGVFTMGAPELDTDAYVDERPAHRVEISRSFYLGKFEVTAGQWQALMGPSSSLGQKDAAYPVTQVSWDEVQAFIRKLQAREPGVTYRLPTEAEWEYAARAGSMTRWSFGDQDDDMHLYGWYEHNANGAAHPVGQLKPNAWGLHDMHGNVWEWVGDRYDKDYYQRAVTRDPQGPERGRYRVFRGGGWSGKAGYARSSARRYVSTGFRHPTIGFRLLREGR